MALTSIVSKQRKLSSELSLDEQVSTLKSLMNNPPQNSRVCEFTPELAEYILENLNYKNRPRKAGKIVLYKKDMQDDNWSLTGETIKFGTDGQLKDGQNRLAACVQAQVPFTTHVIFGIDPNTFHHMDTGKNRSGDDVLAIMGVTNSAKMALTIRFLLSWESGRPDTSGHISNQDIKEAYLNKYDTDLLQEGVSKAQSVWRQTRFPLGAVSASFYEAVKAGYRDEIEAFYHAMETGTGNATSGPVALMRHINVMKNSRIPISSLAYSLLLNRALHCFLKKRRMTKDMFAVSFADKRIPLQSK